MEEYFFVYTHINKTNGKRYIGITGQRLQDRWRDGKGYNGGSVFSNAIKKYGWDGFEHRILLHGITQKQAMMWEAKLIKYYKTTDRKYGYNMTDGGEHAFHTELSKQHIREAKANLSQESLRHVKEAAQRREQIYKQQGKENPFKGKKHTAETRKRMSQNHWSKTNPELFYQCTSINRVGAKNPAAKSVVRLSDGKIYDCIGDCATENKCQRDTIRIHCKGLVKEPKYMYKEDYIKTLGEQHE